MSRLKLAKKLKPVKKAWQSLSNKIQSKFHKINIPKYIKTTLQRLISTFHNSLSHLITTPSKIHLHRSLTTSPRPSYSTSYNNNYHYVQRKNFAAIRIDDLFAEATNKSTNKNVAQAGETSTRGKEVHGNYYKEDLLKGESSGNIDTIEDAWKVVVAKSPQLQVDQKAEEFIHKFRQDMRIQKERSMLEYHEMLARSA